MGKFKCTRIHFAAGKLAQAIKLPVRYLDGLREVVWCHFANSTLSIWYYDAGFTDKPYTVRMVGAGEPCVPCCVLFTCQNVLIVIEEGNTIVETAEKKGEKAA